ncbi:hypothetical protein TNCV_2098181 [Trichonephila clavipes]|nr:hypothetical protein TNCV_2098181 [Trichonephila clavipes]
MNHWDFTTTLPGQIYGMSSYDCSELFRKNGDTGGDIRWATTDQASSATLAGRNRWTQFSLILNYCYATNLGSNQRHGLPAVVMKKVASNSPESSGREPIKHTCHCSCKTRLTGYCPQNPLIEQ